MLVSVGAAGAIESIAPAASFVLGLGNRVMGNRLRLTERIQCTARRRARRAGGVLPAPASRGKLRGRVTRPSSRDLTPPKGVLCIYRRPVRNGRKGQHMRGRGQRASLGEAGNRATMRPAGVLGLLA